MRFRFIRRVGRRRPAIDFPIIYPCAILEHDSWNDYSYRTLFLATLHLSADRQPVQLGQVKILRRDQEPGPPSPVPDEFELLPDDYCSLGQDLDYYETLHAEGRQVFEPFLTALRDMVFSPEIVTAFEDEPGVNTSLLRYTAASQALEDGATVLRGEAVVSDQLVFSYTMPGAKESERFAFGQSPHLPTRCIAVIGYNGAGKTRLLAKLAMVASRDSQAEHNPHAHGAFVGKTPAFGAVVAISYSAFDAFEIPGQGNDPAARAEREHTASTGRVVRPYFYVGLRQVGEDGLISSTLRDQEQQMRDFADAWSRASLRRENTLHQAVALIAHEPSFATLTDLPRPNASEQDWAHAFAALSTGHKIVLMIVTRLCAVIASRTLVLLDEPESHLHPPLVAALLRAVGYVLNEHGAFCVVATHSPVVLQEIPASNVKVMRRNGAIVTFDACELETYGENVGLLTKHVFSLDSSQTDFQGVLQTLAKHLTVEELDGLFGGSMSAQARAIVVSALHGGERKADEGS